MPNMSYCRFENTSGDLRDCCNALEEGDLPESKYEKYAARSLYELAKQYIELYEENADEIKKEACPSDAF